MSMINSTLCYIEKDSSYLMLHRVKKEHDLNRDKWIGIGGHFEFGESPEDCIRREIREETALSAITLAFRGIVTFVYGDECEYMHLFTCDDFQGELCDCDEGELEWVERSRLRTLELWEGDHIFLDLIEDRAQPFFSLKLVYADGGTLTEAVLDGVSLPLPYAAKARAHSTSERTGKKCASGSTAKDSVGVSAQKSGTPKSSADENTSKISAATSPKSVSIYTDGSCRKNPGPGGWGAILVADGRELELCGGCADTTNNRMELTAVITALSKLKKPCRVELTTDSRYVCDGITKGWARSWKKKGWKKGDGSPALNPDLWEQLLELCELHSVSFNWVKGHAGHPYNERCDALAQTESGKYL